MVAPYSMISMHCSLTLVLLAAGVLCSRPDRGIVRFKHVGRNQAGVVVIEVERTVMFLKKPVASSQ